MNRNISTVSKTHTQAHSLSFRMRDIPKAIPNKLKVKRSSNYLCIESEISFSYFTYFCHDFIYVSLWYSWDCLNWIQSFSFCFFSEEKQNYFERKFNRPHLTNRLWKGKKRRNVRLKIDLDRNILFAWAFGPIWKSFSINRPKIHFSWRWLTL